MRVALFDIDGTLVSMGSAAREAFVRALAETVGREVVSDGISFGGKTDPQIARELLARNNVPEDRMEAAIAETVRRYLVHFERDLPRAQGARLLPGVLELLEALARRDDVAVALLTGNVEPGARLKLGYFDLGKHFDFEVSAFGSDHHDRYRLPGIVLERARRRFGTGVAGTDLVILGDSEHDVLCGREVGARSCAVATGWTPEPTLRALGPHHLFADFSDTAAVVAAIAEGAPCPAG
ncbi:MAG TPA: HAD family hydrolase [Verrucomicrobiae bacterium]|nr:HAD family hydrolase [Verrucomicrobiae bacterium]